MKVDFNEQELQVLMGMIDVAVRSQGLNAAANAVHLAQKIRAAAEPEAPTLEEIEETE